MKKPLGPILLFLLPNRIHLFNTREFPLKDHPPFSSSNCIETQAEDLWEQGYILSIPNYLIDLMVRQLRIEFPGACYYVTSRGNERKTIFRGKRDREKFLSYLQSASQRYDAVIHAYCLMNNHYHILIKTPLGNLSRIMQHINGAYTGYFNLKHQRIGHLFQGRYRSILMEMEKYALSVSRHIHLNPVRLGIVENPQEYEWSSYCYYLMEEAPSWLSRDSILHYFGKELPTARNKYKEYVDTALNQEYQSPFGQITHSVILSSAEFALKIKKEFLKNKNWDRNLPAVEDLINKSEIKQIFDVVDSMIKSNNKLARQIKIYLCHKYSGQKLKEIGAYFNIGDSGVTQTSRRIVEKIKNDAKLKKQINILEKRLDLTS